MLIKNYLKFTIRIGLVTLMSLGVAKSAEATSFDLTNGSSSTVLDNFSTNDLSNNVTSQNENIAQAYQFSADNLAADGGLLTSQQDTGILEVPEPSTLLGLGGLGLSLFGRKGIKKVKDLLRNLKA